MALPLLFGASTMPRQTRPAKPRFNINDTYVAVRPIRISATKRIEPGEEVNSLLSRHGLRRRAKIRAVGPKGHPWTVYMLAAFESEDAPIMELEDESEEKEEIQAEESEDQDSENFPDMFANDEE